MNTMQHDAPSSFLAEIELHEWFVTPGKSTYIPIQLTNQEEATQMLHLSVEGIPSQWIENVPNQIVLPPLEHKSIALLIHPPEAPMTHAGRYPIQLTVAQMENGRDQTVLEGVLTVAAYEIEGRIALLMETLHYAVAPGNSVTVQFKVINQGLEEDTFQLKVDGLPSAWLSTPTPSLKLQPGEQKTVTVLIRPARHFKSRAGRHPFTILVESQLNPTEPAKVECVLTIEAFADFKSQMLPKRVSLGDPVQVVIENSGNIPSSYQLQWVSPDERLNFEWIPSNLPENTLKFADTAATLRIAAGETISLAFTPKSRTGPNLVGTGISPYKIHIEAADGTVQSHEGEMVSRGLIPVWVVQVGVLLLLTAMCLASLLFARGNFASGQATATALASIADSTETVVAAATQTAGATQTAIINMTQAAEAGQTDEDGDGLTAAQEQTLGTDPQQADSDQDGVLDGAEVAGATDPLNPDSDGDSLIDGEELQRGTDPLNPDTDMDALSDGQEVQLGTDPLDPDTDEDGLLDGNETPPCPDPRNPDTDGDGLIDSQDLDACDANNPSLTATALAALPTETSTSPTEIPPTEIPTEAPTPIPTAPTGATETPQPTALPLNGTLAFVSTRDGNPEIYTLNLADNQLTRLTNDPATEAQPSWSPDGQQIAFASNRDGNFEIYVMNADGTGLVNLTNDPSDDFDPAWAMDNSRIAFVSNRDGNNEIYLMNPDGTSLYNVTNNSANDSQPSWFIKGGFLPTLQIAFQSDRDNNSEIYAINPSGIGPTNLSNNAATEEFPAGLGDSGVIAFTTDRDGDQEIYIMSDDGSTQTNLTNQPLASDWSPAWAATPEWLAFVSNRDGNQEIYVLNGENQINVTNTPGDDYDPAWFVAP